MFHKKHHPSQHMVAACWQVPQVTGSWVDHPNPEHIGLYDPRNGCPEYAEDFNCLRPYPPAQPNPDLAAREFRKVRFICTLTLSK